MDLNKKLIKEFARDYARAVRDHFGESLISLVLFGSVARGEAGPHSDVDLLIVARDLPQGRLARQKLLEPVDARFEAQRLEWVRRGWFVDVSPILKTPEEAARIVPLYLDMVEDAEILFDRDGFFEGVLEDLRQRLARLGARRIRRGRYWYWDLKPDYRPGEVFEI